MLCLHEHLGVSEVPDFPDVILRLSDVDLRDILHHEPCHWDEIAQGYLLGKGTKELVLSAELSSPGSCSLLYPFQEPNISLKAG